MEKEIKQIKSKRRVASFGEVYTNSRDVNAMLDLVNDQVSRIDSTFLEPAAGNGNFLVEVFKRKLITVRRKYKNNKLEYEKYSFIAISSIYGIDILHDNVIECRERLFEIFNKEYTKLYKEHCSDDIRNSIKYLLSKNIICGDGLTGLKNGESAEAIIFSEWSMYESFIKRRDFAMNDLIAYKEINTKKSNILKPRREFERIGFREVSKLG